MSICCDWGYTDSDVYQCIDYFFKRIYFHSLRITCIAHKGNEEIQNLTVVGAKETSPNLRYYENTANLSRPKQRVCPIIQWDSMNRKIRTCTYSLYEDVFLFCDQEIV